MHKHLHIVSLNVPFPVDYGGVFDLFYKLPALQQQSVKIHLHCFDYGRGQQPILTDYCETVSYYPRKRGLNAISLHCPHIVKSRSHHELRNALLKDDYPVLMEGVHCTYFLNDPAFAGRRCLVRLHNIEHVYYRHLYDFAAPGLRKLYYLWESRLLKNYEKMIADKATFISVTQKDAVEYGKVGCRSVLHLPLFLPEWQVSTTEGKGSFCLYQGDLSVAENEKAAKWLITQVFNGLNIPFVIAGKNPSERLRQLVNARSCTCLVANPHEQEMQDLIAKAHINLIPSYNTTGIKLKFLNALYNGRHCVVNQATVEGTGLERCCHVANTAAGFRNVIENLFQEAFSAGQIAQRHLLLDHLFDNQSNAKKLVKIIWQ